MPTIGVASAEPAAVSTEPADGIARSLGDLGYEIGKTYERRSIPGSSRHPSDRVTVLALLFYRDWRGATVRVRWADGSVHEHGTPHNPREFAEVSD